MRVIHNQWASFTSSNGIQLKTRPKIVMSNCVGQPKLRTNENDQNKWLCFKNVTYVDQNNYGCSKAL